MRPFPWNLVGSTTYNVHVVPNKFRTTLHVFIIDSGREMVKNTELKLMATQVDMGR